jgi:hypothetical protein
MKTPACRSALVLHSLLIRTTVRGAVDAVTAEELPYVSSKLSMVLEQDPCAESG